MFFLPDFPLYGINYNQISRKGTIFYDLRKAVTSQTRSECYKHNFIVCCFLYINNTRYQGKVYCAQITVKNKPFRDCFKSLRLQTIHFTRSTDIDFYSIYPLWFLEIRRNLSGKFSRSTCNKLYNSNSVGQ